MNPIICRLLGGLYDGLTIDVGELDELPDFWFVREELDVRCQRVTRARPDAERGGEGYILSAFEGGPEAFYSHASVRCSVAVSPGCAHCYALTLAKRLKAMGNPRYQVDGGPASGPGFGVTLHPDKLDEPLRWRRPRMVFVNSMSDLFHEEIPEEFIARVFDVMERCSYPQSGPVHTFQVLTKRPDRMRDFMLARQAARQEYADKFDRLPPSTDRRGWLGATSDSFAAEDARARAATPPANIWLGVSIENRRFVQRADLLRETPAAVRFVSAEPLLGPLVPRAHGCWCFASVERNHPEDWPDGYHGSALSLEGIDWLICGDESGPRHRRFDPQWAIDLRDACDHSDTAFFMKQMGGHRPGGALEDLPPELRIRDMPRTAVPA